MTVEQFYQEIGMAALDQSNGQAKKILVYAEVEDGVISADLFYMNDAGMVFFRFCSEAMRALIYSFWEGWRNVPDNREWRVMCYVLIGAEFSMNLIYPDQIDLNEGESDRRPRAVKKYFGDVKVDYSKQN